MFRQREDYEEKNKERKRQKVTMDHFMSSWYYRYIEEI